MRLLYLASDFIPRDELGFHDAFEKMLGDGTLEKYQAISFYHVARQHGWSEVWKKAVQAAKQIDADTVYVQNFLNNVQQPEQFIASLRALPTNPVVFASTGDGFGVIMGYKIPKCFLNTARASDITFLCGMGRMARQFHKRGVRNIYFLPNSTCQVRFSAPLDLSSYRPEFDVVFIGNRKKFRNPFNRFPGYPDRDKLVATFSLHYGKKFAVFGEGWDGNPCAMDKLPFNDQHKAYRRSRICIGYPPWLDIDYYCSNRTYIAIASGIPYLERRVPRLQTLLKDKKHCFMYHSIDEAVEICDQLLKRDIDDLLNLGRDASQYILARHTNERRMRLVVDIVKKFREAKNKNEKPLLPEYDFFLNSISTESQQPYCTVF